jgi:limonene-1,2-epoxide hydrolase
MGGIEQDRTHVKRLGYDAVIAMRAPRVVSLPITPHVHDRLAACVGAAELDIHSEAAGGKEVCHSRQDAQDDDSLERTRARNVSDR